ncbi:MAG: NAD-binding protein [Verrucomicrobiales bacterium]
MRPAASASPPAASGSRESDHHLEIAARGTSRTTNEKQLIGHGLTSCATCDGAFYRDVPVCVIGGGDSACEEAMFLTRFASKVYLIHRRDELRASKIMAERTLANEKIEPVWNSVVTEYLTGESGEMRAVKLRDTETGEESELAVDCVFVAISAHPKTPGSSAI